MLILREKKTINEIININHFPNGFIKGVVDVEKELVALDADMHFELADYLKDSEGSMEENLWGFNLWLENDGIEEILEFDSLINIHNNQLHGFSRGGMDIKDENICNKATEVIEKWIQF